MPKVCCFCRAATKLTKEHLYAQWINDLFAPAMVGLGQSTAEIVLRDGTTSVFPIRYVEQTLRVVCGKCNSGWMSALEAGVQPFLGRMLLSPQQAVRLKPRQQQLLAAWAVKTAFVSEFLHPTERIVPDSEYDRFYSAREPMPGYRVWVGFRRDLFDATSGRSALSLLRTESVPFVRVPTTLSEEFKNASDGNATVFRITFTIGHVVFVVFGHNYPGGFQIDSNLPRVVDEIWPVDRKITWPPPLSVEQIGGFRVLHDTFGTKPPAPSP
jgi:hypothetical protein